MFYVNSMQLLTSIITVIEFCVDSNLEYMYFIVDSTQYTPCKGITEEKKKVARIADKGQQRRRPRLQLRQQRQESPKLLPMVAAARGGEGVGKMCKAKAK